jgi:hypothetical protein
MPNSLRDTDLIPLHAWLIEAGTNDVAAEPLFDGFCGRLVAAGVPIARGFLSIAGLHPLRRAYSLTWHDGRIVEATVTATLRIPSCVQIHAFYKPNLRKPVFPRIDPANCKTSRCPRTRECA